MKRYDNIILDNLYAPKTDNNIWLKDHKLYYYTNGKWQLIGGDISTKDINEIKESLSSKADKSDLPDVSKFVDDAEYKDLRIYFKNNGEDIFYLEAAPFIKDGMVNKVDIEGNNLVVTFNTDAGLDPISIPLSKIFDANNYYDKEAIDDFLKAIGEQFKTLEFTNVVENDETIPTVTIEQSDKDIVLYDKSQISKLLKTKVSFTDLFNILSIWPVISGTKCWMGTLEEYFTLDDIDPEANYIVFANKDNSLYAVYKNEETVWASRDFSNLLEGKASMLFSFSYIYADETTTNTATVPIDENGYFSYYFDKPVKKISFKSKSAIDNITQLPTSAKVTSIANMFDNTYVRYVNFIGYDLSNLTGNLLCLFVENKRYEGRIKFTGTNIFKNTSYILLMFYNGFKIRSIDCSNWDTRTVTGYAHAMFESCRNLKKLTLGPNCTFGKITGYFYNNFYDMWELEKLDISMIDLSNKTNLSYFIYNNPKLREVHINSSFKKVTSTDIFGACPSLENIIGEIRDFPISLYVGSSSLLTPESCMVIINGLAEVEGKTLTFHADAYDRLTEEQLAVGTAKGWSIVRK